jgi:hypothetical protein
LGLGGVAAYWFFGSPDVVERWGPKGEHYTFVARTGGVTVQPDGQDLRAVAESVSEVTVYGRVRCVLDAGSELRGTLPGTGTRLTGGRAWFEVAPGPFWVDVDDAQVNVQGTAFEVDARVRNHPVVSVEHGEVSIGGISVNAGQRYEDGKVSASAERPGAFFRRPLLRLEGPGSAKPGESVSLRFVLENPTFLEQTIAGPDTVASGALLTLAGPDGSTQTQGLDFAQAVSGGLAAKHPVSLAPKERRLVVFSVRLPPAPPGRWGLTALYRPSGEAPLASDPLSVEVR